MGWMQFIVGMTGALAWPVAVLAALVLFRTPLGLLLKDRRLSRLRVGPVEAEWNELLTEANVIELAEQVTLSDGTGLTDIAAVKVQPDKARPLPAPPATTAARPPLRHGSLRLIDWYLATPGVEPLSAIITAYLELEGRLASLVGANALFAGVGAEGLAVTASINGRIRPTTVELVKRASGLHQLALQSATAGPQFVDRTKALQYLQLVDKILDEVEQAERDSHA